MINIIKNTTEYEILTTAGILTAQLLKDLKQALRPEISTEFLNRKAQQFLQKHHLVSSFYGVNGYNAHICVSLNDCAVHGVPSEKIFCTSGDLVSVDVGIKYRGWCTDAARTWILPKSSSLGRRLKETAERAFWEAIKIIKVNETTIGDLGYIINLTAEKAGFRVVKSLCGHGVGRTLHEEPLIPNYGTPGTGVVLKSGMLLAIEPILSAGNGEIYNKNSGIYSKDNSLTAHYENTVLITAYGPKVLTLLPHKNLNKAF